MTPTLELAVFHRKNTNLYKLELTDQRGRLLHTRYLRPAEVQSLSGRYSRVLETAHTLRLVCPFPQVA